jgi:hypothetical protein
MHKPEKNEHHELTPADRELEAALGSLTPAGTGIDRDGLMFDLGRSSGGRQLRIWQGASGLMMAVLAMLIAFPLLNPPTGTESGQNNMVKDNAPKIDPPNATDQKDQEQTPVKHIQDHQIALTNNHPLPALLTLKQREGSYLAMRQIALSRGVDALPLPEQSANRLNSDTLNMRWRKGPGITKPLNQRF